MATRPLKLRQASAYFRLAAKFDQNHHPVEASHYRRVADRLVEENRRDRERLKAWGKR